MGSPTRDELKLLLRDAYSKSKRLALESDSSFRHDEELAWDAVADVVMGLVADSDENLASAFERGASQDRELAALRAENERLRVKHVLTSRHHAERAVNQWMDYMGSPSESFTPSEMEALRRFVADEVDAALRAPAEGGRG